MSETQKPKAIRKRTLRSAQPSQRNGAGPAPEQQDLLLGQRVEQARQRTLALLARALDQPTDRRSSVTLELRFDLRGSTAGQLRVRGRGDYLIRYNLALLEREGMDFIRRTVPHEVAHLAVHRRYGPSARPHGPEWQAMMRALGAEPSRCHNYDVSGLSQRRLRRFVYHCNCCQHELSSIRHNRIIKGQVYHCRRCGGALRPGAEPRRVG